MATRSVVRALYVSDILGPGTAFTRRVDDHLYTQPVLGWVAPAGGELPIPHGLRPRHALGLDSSGRRHTVVVATVTADLWTRASLIWQVLDDTGTLIDVVTTGLVGEQFTP